MENTIEMLKVLDENTSSVQNNLINSINENLNHLYKIIVLGVVISFIGIFGFQQKQFLIAIVLTSLDYVISVIDCHLKIKLVRNKADEIKSILDFELVENQNKFDEYVGLLKNIHHPDRLGKLCNLMSLLGYFFWLFGIIINLT